MNGLRASTRAIEGLHDWILAKATIQYERRSAGKFNGSAGTVHGGVVALPLRQGVVNEFNGALLGFAGRMEGSDEDVWSDLGRALYDLQNCVSRSSLLVATIVTRTRGSRLRCVPF